MPPLMIAGVFVSSDASWRLTKHNELSQAGGRKRKAVSGERETARGKASKRRHQRRTRYWCGLPSPVLSGSGS